MDRLYFEAPGPGRQEDAAAYIGEFYAYGSAIYGTGGLHRYLNDYAGWLRKLSADAARAPDDDKVPARTFFLVREGDGRIVGMINIRLALNEKLRRFGGHIGYSIAKEHRGKGYGTVGLRLTIQIAKDIVPEEEIYLRVNKDNISSQKVMKKNGAYPVGEDEEHIFMRIAK